jgi:dTDP-4-dehydrorhamnose reductase
MNLYWPQIGKFDCLVNGPSSEYPTPKTPAFLYWIKRRLEKCMVSVPDYEDSLRKCIGLLRIETN